MTFIVVAYVIIGTIVYALTDTSAIASRVSAPLLGPSYGAVQKYLFLVVVALWPVWLVLLVTRSRP